jgi:hypothetical protein
MICPGLVACGIRFLPEKPSMVSHYFILTIYKLIAKRREEQARAMVTKYHANGVPDHPIVDLEMREMREDLAQSGDMTKPKITLISVSCSTLVPIVIEQCFASQ